MSRLKFFLRDQSDDISMVPKVTMAEELGWGTLNGPMRVSRKESSLKES